MPNRHDAGVAVWEPEGENWIRWARTPGFDSYWYFRDAVFDAVLPPPEGRALEVGCGEGRVTRDLVERGYDVVALDPAETLVRAAVDEDAVRRYAIAVGEALPFPDDRFDLVVSYNVLQNVADLPRSVQEIARVLRPGGALCACIVHPFTDLGGFEHDGEGARFVLRDRYYNARRIEETEERDGISMTFRGWTYPLEDYTRAFESAGLSIDRIREPRPAQHPDRYDRWLEVPLFLALRAVNSVVSPA
jgi:SAM-dependent methyltransferase